MEQTTNTILMVRPASFRANEQTAINNHYQKEINDVAQATLEVKAQEEFDAFVAKLRGVGVHVVVFVAAELAFLGIAGEDELRRIEHHGLVRRHLPNRHRSPVQVAMLDLNRPDAAIDPELPDFESSDWRYCWVQLWFLLS